MPELVSLKAVDARRVPWRNGGGVTEELAVFPAGASFETGDFDARVSKSTIDRAGPFSAFPGFDRVLVVLAGDGLVLDHGDAAPRASLRRLEPHVFSGDWPTTAELPNGPVADFNVIVRRGVRRADVRTCAPGRRPLSATLEAGDALVHVLVGPMIVRCGGDGRMIVVAPNDSLCVRGARAGDKLQLVGPADDCLALLVRMPSV
jgi:environmental stress-induced protein Ves